MVFMIPSSCFLDNRSVFLAGAYNISVSPATIKSANVDPDHVLACSRFMRCTHASIHMSAS